MTYPLLSVVSYFPTKLWRQNTCLLPFRQRPIEIRRRYLLRLRRLSVLLLLTPGRLLRILNINLGLLLLDLLLNQFGYFVPPLVEVLEVGEMVLVAR